MNRIQQTLQNIKTLKKINQKIYDISIDALGVRVTKLETIPKETNVSEDGTTNIDVCLGNINPVTERKYLFVLNANRKYIIHAVIFIILTKENK